MSSGVNPAVEFPVLSSEEERVLVVLRGIAAGLRAGRGALEIAAFAEALGVAGAVPWPKSPVQGSLAFTLGSAHFLLSKPVGPHEAIELNFVE